MGYALLYSSPYKCLIKSTLYNFGGANRNTFVNKPRWLIGNGKDINVYKQIGKFSLEVLDCQMILSVLRKLSTHKGWIFYTIRLFVCVRHL